MVNQKITVIGAKGYIGSLLCRLMEVPEHRQYDLPDGDIRNPDICKQIARNSDVIINLAAISGIKACDEDTRGAMETNREAAVDLYHQAVEAGVKRYIFASSSAVYGASDAFRVDEDHEMNPRNTYGITKMLAELDMREIKGETKLIIFRKSNVYGYGLTMKGMTVLDRFIEKYLLRGSFTIVGTGAQMRDFVHIADTVNLYRKAAEFYNVRPGTYNVGGGECISIRGLADLVNDIGEELLGYRVSTEFISGSEGDGWRDFRYVCDKARMEFRFHPVFRLSDYIKERMLMHLRGEKK